MATDIVVDFQEYGLNVPDITKVDNDTLKGLGKEIIDKFKKYGYCYLKGHGVDEGLLAEYMKVSRDFFERPEEFKAKYPMGHDYAFGWVKLEQERGNEKRSVGDLHEAFNFLPACSYNNVWPPVDRFESLAKQLHEIGKDLAHRFLDVLSLGLDLPVNFLRDAHQKQQLQVRSVYYPPIKHGRQVAPDQVRIGEHFDWGTVTFDFQDDVGGLQVKNPEGEFVEVKPIPGAVLVTPSALLQRWTSDSIKAAVHRILLDEERRLKTRQAIIFFVQPDEDFEIKCIDGSNKYEPITSKDFWMSRAKLSLTY